MGEFHDDLRLSRDDDTARLEAAAAALASAAERLGRVGALLDEVYYIGLWHKSDDCSDNRRKRQGLKEAGWEVSYAGRQLEAEAPRPRHPDVADAFDALGAELDALEASIEPLAEVVTETMGDNPALDCDISSVSARLSELIERVGRMAALYRVRARRERERAASSGAESPR